MTPNRSEKTLQNLQDNLLADIEAMRKNMQARVPSDIEDVSEAYERYARILTMLSKTLEVMSRLQTQKKRMQYPKVTRKTGNRLSPILSKNWPGWRKPKLRRHLLRGLSDAEVAALYWHWGLRAISWPYMKTPLGIFSRRVRAGDFGMRRAKISLFSTLPIGNRFCRKTAPLPVSSPR